ncbi:dTDP-6-deoxy-3,4-keto-hexulose isomerase [Aggregatimonas sangjinii]|uniref:dTDP-6-deoxy-3,4-keto-hexulose isomerase n=1 Tax=Aggregatimonas sangjinii TaxID=2583587 RepID=A0A5B7SK01_9FLAO|nr:WxcM-like domain-containing protein [Aggregatimonas sangjinii]QCW98804.1 dTDP-6-deoxy-3,4-keto-hexulose isomerase [Aggregatimonas sangjinii]
MMSFQFIKGNVFKDARGSLRFFNTFNMGDIIRMYEIVPSDAEFTRGWQAHKYETKWFYCSQGSFQINVVKIDDFQNPSVKLVPTAFRLSEKEPVILEVIGGAATAIKATESDSKLTVFSNFTLEESKKDDFRYDLKTWQLQ